MLWYQTPRAVASRDENERERREKVIDYVYRGAIRQPCSINLTSASPSGLLLFS